MGVLTSEHPKCMTEISGRETILSRQLSQIADQGIEEVVMTTGRHDQVQMCIRDRFRSDAAGLMIFPSPEFCI